MYGVTQDDLEPILPVVQSLFGDVNVDEIGSWCLLPFCCGLVYGGSFSGKTAFVENTRPQEDFRNSLKGVKSEEMLAWDFHEQIAEWLADDVLRQFIRDRLKNSQIGAEPEALEDAIPYFALGMVLQRLGKGESSRLLKDYRSWVENAGGSWLRLFFVAGMLLRGDDTFSGQSFYSTILRINTEPVRSQIKRLFTENYAS